MGHIGIYGDRASNIALQKCDLLISIGNRLAIPQIGYDKSDFGRKAKKWVVEIDPTECSKFADTDWQILNISAHDFLLSMNTGFEVKGTSNDRDRWLTELENLWAALPRINQVGPMFDEFPNVIHSAKVVEFLNSHLDPNAIIVTDVGAGLLTGHYLFEPKGTQRLFTSQGLGEMGFGLPGAIGAYFADPHRQLICLNTDGGIMFNLQELQLISEHDIPLKLFVFNNDGYSMIKISQQNLFAGRMSGSGPESGVSFPKFSDIAASFKMKHVRIESLTDLDTKLKSAINSKQAMFIEIMMPREQRYLPRLSTAKLENGTLISPPLEDLDPLLPIEELEKYLGYKAHKNSYQSRDISYAPN
jgi:acetolactate synthase-1/2/3 large subunit